MFDVPAFLKRLRSTGCSLGEPFTFFETTTSTNTEAKLALKSGAPPGATFLANEQTAGRGRQGRSWHALANEGLLFSFILQPELPPERISALTLVVGLAVRECLAAHASVPLQLKWPNDILAITAHGRKKKLAGILVESEIHPGKPASVIVGVGINTHHRQFPPELAGTATSLLLLRGNLAESPLPSRELLLQELLVSIEAWLNRFTASGFEAIVPALNEHDALRGAQLRIVTAEGNSVVGTAAGIGPQGSLLLQTDTGLVAINSGTVESL